MEITDIFDADCQPTGKTLIRGDKPKEGEYIMAVAAVIQVKDRYLITKRSVHKSRAGMWEFPGGGSQRGESPTDALLRELEEETGIVPQKEQITYLKRVYHAPYRLFLQVFLVETDVTMEELCLQEEEIEEAMFVTPEELQGVYSKLTDMDKQIYDEVVKDREI